MKTRLGKMKKNLWGVSFPLPSLERLLLMAKIKTKIPIHGIFSLSAKCLKRKWMSQKTSLTRLNLRRSGGVDANPPIRFSWNLSETNYHLDLPFSLAVRISLRHILTQGW